MILTNSQKRYITISNIFVPFLLGIGIDLYVPSLPSIVNYFHTSTYLVQFTIGLYMLGYGAGQSFLGILSDSIGRKKVYLGSVLFYTVVSFMAIFSPNIYFLNVCRLLQGLGVAGFGVTRRAIVADCFVGKELIKAMTVISISWSMGPILGPFIGGYLQHYFNWQANFYLFGFYSLFIFIYASILIPETNLNLRSFNTKKLLGSIKTIVIHPIFIFGSIILALLYSTLVMFNTVGPFLIQIVLKYSVVAYGHIALLLGFGYFAGNVVNRFALRFAPSMRVSSFGIISAVCISIVMLLLAILVPINLYIIVTPAFFLFMSCGLIFPNLMAKCMGLFPQMAGAASAIFGSFVAGGVFVMTMFTTTLKTNSQIPLALTYLVMMLICSILFIICIRKLGSCKCK